MTNHEFKSEGSMSHEGGKGQSIQGFEHDWHGGQWNRSEELPIAIDFSVGNGLYNPGYTDGQQAYYPIGYGGNSASVAFGNGDNSVTTGGYEDNPIIVGDATAYTNAGYAETGNGEKHGRLDCLTPKYDKYANVPIDQLPDDGTATAELNRREFARIERENVIAQAQYQPGMSHNRWSHSAYTNDNEAAAQQGGYQKPHWWQRNWQV